MVNSFLAPSVQPASMSWTSRDTGPVGRKWRVGKERGRCAWVWPLAVDHQFVDQELRTLYKKKFMLSAFE